MNNPSVCHSPNPGSDAAIALGCKCPVIDNGHGRGLPDGSFWFSANCPVHATEENPLADGAPRQEPRPANPQDEPLS